jgi:hypothetical protein
VHYVLISLAYGACSPTAGITGVESIIVELTPLLCLLPCPLILLCGWREEKKGAERGERKRVEGVLFVATCGVSNAED